MQLRSKQPPTHRYRDVIYDSAVDPQEQTNEESSYMTNDTELTPFLTLEDANNDEDTPANNTRLLLGLRDSRMNQWPDSATVTAAGQ